MARKTAVRKPIPQVQNLFLRSENFGVSPWEAMQGGTLLADAIPTSPLEGKGMTAMVESGANARRYTGQTPPSNMLGKVVTFRVFAKKGTRNYLLLFCNTGTALVWFNLNTGVVETTSGGATGRMIEQDDGSYSCELTVKLTSLSSLYIEAIAVLGELGYQGVNGAQAVYITGAQAVIGKRTGDYVETAGVRVNTGNLRKTADRKPIIQTQNLLLDSAVLDSENNFILEGTIEEVEELNPLNGSNIVYRITDNEVDQYHGLGQGFAHLTAPKYQNVLRDWPICLWALVKPETMNLVALDFLLLGADTWGLFDLENEEVLELLTAEVAGVAKNIEGRITKREDGWYLIEVNLIANNSQDIYPFTDLGVYVLSSLAAEGNQTSIFYPGSGQSFLCAGYGVTLSNQSSLVVSEDEPVNEDGTMRKKIR